MGQSSRSMKIFVAIFFNMLAFANLSLSQSFIRVEGTQFVRDGRPYYFLGANFWYGMNLASPGPGGDRQRLLRELDSLRALGIDNLRIMAASEGPATEPWRMKPVLQPAPGQYDEDLLDGLDFLLAEMGKRGMYAVVCLNNFWQWSGGMAQYRAWVEGSAIPYPDPSTGKGWFSYMTYTSGFYSNADARAAFREFLTIVITRRNVYTGRRYFDDPVIMAWELANEPRGMLRAGAYRRWIRETAAFIKSLDPNHLVCTGSEGNTNVPTGNHFRKDHASPDIDYTTIHLWIQNWGWYDPADPEGSYPRAMKKMEEYLQHHLQMAKKLGKPLVLEEFGIARDGGSYDPAAGTSWRDRYFDQVFEMVYRLAAEGAPVAGSNFWAWSGAGRPRQPGAVWQAGDDWTGDPPHEFQGWYSVYDRDDSTQAVIRQHAAAMKRLATGE